MKDPFGGLITKALWANVHAAQGESQAADQEMNEVLDDLASQHKNTPAAKQNDLVQGIGQLKGILNHFSVHDYDYVMAQSPHFRKLLEVVNDLAKSCNQPEQLCHLAMQLAIHVNGYSIFG